MTTKVKIGYDVSCAVGLSGHTDSADSGIDHFVSFVWQHEISRYKVKDDQ
jgi:hypothetical protein